MRSESSVGLRRFAAREDAVVVGRVEVVLRLDLLGHELLREQLRDGERHRRRERGDGRETEQRGHVEVGAGFDGLHTDAQESEASTKHRGEK